MDIKATTREDQIRLAEQIARDNPEWQIRTPRTGWDVVRLHRQGGAWVSLRWGRWLAYDSDGRLLCGHLDSPAAAIRALGYALESP